MQRSTTQRTSTMVSAPHCVPAHEPRHAPRLPLATHCALVCQHQHARALTGSLLRAFSRSRGLLQLHVQPELGAGLGAAGLHVVPVRGHRGKQHGRRRAARPCCACVDDRALRQGAAIAAGWRTEWEPLALPWWARGADAAGACPPRPAWTRAPTAPPVGRSVSGAATHHGRPTPHSRPLPRTTSTPLEPSPSPARRCGGHRPATPQAAAHFPAAQATTRRARLCGGYTRAVGGGGALVCFADRGAGGCA